MSSSFDKLYDTATIDNFFFILMGKKLAIKVGYFEKYPKYILKKRCQKGFSRVMLRVKPVVFLKKMAKNFQWSYFKELKR